MPCKAVAEHDINQPEMNLTQKMDLYRKTEDASVFNQKDYRALYGRLDTARSKDTTGKVVPPTLCVQ